MTALFDRPHPAHLAATFEPVMWFGTFIHEGELFVIYANVHGRINACFRDQMIADVRYVSDLEKVAGSGRTGPGWVDLEDLEATPDAVVNLGAEMTPEKLEEMKPTLAQEAAKALIEGRDYITDSEGHRYDVKTMRELPPEE